MTNIVKLVKHVPWLCAAFAVASFGLSFCGFISSARAQETGIKCTKSTWPTCASNQGCSGIGDEQCGSGTGDDFGKCVC